MSVEKQDRIRELNQLISERLAEREHEVQQYRDANQGLKESLALSMRITILGSLPSIVWLGCWASVTSATEPTPYQIVFACGTVVIFAAILAAAARGSGLVAHWLFWRSAVNERLATIIIALLANALLFGWVMVFADW